MDVRIFSGNAHHELAENVCHFLGNNLEPARADRFKDGEIRIELGNSVRGADVFVIQPTPAPADNWFELFLLIDALRRSSAERITAVIPYCGYSCQDRKDRPHVPVSIDLMGRFVQEAGANRVLLLDMHNEATIAFFGPRVDHLYASTVLVPVCREIGVNPRDWVVVSSDVGRAERTRGFSRRIHSELPVAIVDKRRTDDASTRVMNIIGEVADKNLLLFDDMIRTASTMIQDVEALKRAGAGKIISCVTHLDLTEGALERIVASGVELVIATDSLPFQAPREQQAKFRIVSIAELLAKVIKRIHSNDSVTSLYLP